MELIQLSFDKIMQTRSHTVIVLKSKEKKFAIYADPHVGKSLQMYIIDAEKSRPLTHDLIQSILRGLDVQVKQIVINDFQDPIYYARLFLEQQIGSTRHLVEIDARPSDCITLAIIHKIPLFCKSDVLERAVAIVD